MKPEPIEFLPVPRFWKQRPYVRQAERAFLYGIAVGSGATLLMAFVIHWLLQIMARGGLTT
jgi:hypothetical protein